MAYTIYRNVKIDRVYTERVTPGTRTRDIGDSTRQRDPYDVQMLAIHHGATKATFSDFKALIHQGDMVSLAINDKEDVIAVINHTRNKDAKLQRNKMSAGDIGGILFFLAFPVVIGGAIFRKVFTSHGWDSVTVGIAGVVILIVILVLRGINKQYIESDRALKELRDR